jgi:small subunit ribosomal protein S16
VAVLLRKVREGNWGTAKAPPPLTPPKEPTAEAESSEAAEGEATEAPAEAAAE